MAVSNNWTSSCVKPIYTLGGNILQTPKTPKLASSKSKKTKVAKNKIPSKEPDNSADGTASTAKFQGWSIEGIKRFNLIYDVITKERQSENGINFEKEFLMYCISARENKNKTAKKKKIVSYEVCKHNLWDTNVDMGQTEASLPVITIKESTNEILEEEVEEV